MSVSESVLEISGQSEFWRFRNIWFCTPQNIQPTYPQRNADYVADMYIQHLWGRAMLVEIIVVTHTRVIDTTITSMLASTAMRIFWSICNCAHFHLSWLLTAAVPRISIRYSTTLSYRYFEDEQEESRRFILWILDNSAVLDLWDDVLVVAFISRHYFPYI